MKKIKKSGVLKDNESESDLTEFARFCLDLRGFNLQSNGRQVDKWEAFDRGYKDADAIKKGRTAIVVTERLYPDTK